MVQTIDRIPREHGAGAGERDEKAQAEKVGQEEPRSGRTEGEKARSEEPGPAGASPEAGRPQAASDRRRRAAAAERLIEAAGPLFAERPFDAVSTRELAAAAAVNLSAITYHFGGKERLYRAVIQRLVDDLEAHRRAVIALLRGGVERAAGDREQLARLAGDFVGYLIGFLLSSALPRWRMQLMLREITQPSAAFALIMGEHIDPLHDAVAELVAAAIGGAPGDEATRLLTQDVVGQCLSFGLGRSVVLWRLGWDDYTPGRVAQVVRAVTPAVLAALGLPPPDGDGAATAPQT